jgi:hypothetical protein
MKNRCFQNNAGGLGEFFKKWKKKKKKKDETDSSSERVLLGLSNIKSSHQVRRIETSVRNEMIVASSPSAQMIVCNLYCRVG